MLSGFRNSLSIVALAGLVIAQPAMATRSSDSLPVAGAKVAPVQGQRAGSKVGKSEEVTGGFIIPVVAVIAIITGAILIFDGNNNSPG